jgi:hypothetical protein
LGPKTGRIKTFQLTMTRHSFSPIQQSPKA